MDEERAKRDQEIIIKILKKYLQIVTIITLGMSGRRTRLFSEKGGNTWMMKS